MRQNHELGRALCEARREKELMAAAAARGAPPSPAPTVRQRREKPSNEEGEEEETEEDEEGRVEEEEQRPLCSGVAGYPVVRDHALGHGLGEGADAQASDGLQIPPYKGEIIF